MRQRDNTPKYFDNVSLGASTVLASTREIELGPTGWLGLQVIIDNGAGGAPSDTPVGSWELHATGDGARFTKIVDTLLDAELARGAPNGNNVVDQWLIVHGVPGTSIKLRYVRASGGGSDARATVNVTTW